MDKVTLRYGGTTLDLHKSATLVAVKPEHGREPAVRRAAERNGAQAVQRLDGFEVFEVGAAPQMESALDDMRRSVPDAVGTHVFHTSDDGVPFVPTGDLYLVFDDTAKDEDCQTLIDDNALQVVEARGDRTLIVRVTRDSPNPLKVAEALQKSPLVAVAEPELATPGKIAAFMVPADDMLSRQWHLENTGMLDGSSLGLKKGADARVVAAWKRAGTLGSPTVHVAVIDDGFDLSHPDLKGRVVAPWDFTRNNDSPLPEFSADYPYYSPRNGEWVGDWHGTACAGVALGRANGTGVVGAAPGCSFMPVRWGVNLADSQIEAWFRYVRRSGAWVVSCSWGAAAAYFPLSTRARRAISECAAEGRNGKGAVICFAAGNEDRDIDAPAQGSLNGFAIHPDVIAVAACTSMDMRSNYSNFGKAISICAPSSGAGGRGIMTADVAGTFRNGGRTIESGYSPGAYTNSFGGTSSATPLVAGICALLLSLDDTLTAAEVKSVIERTARKIPDASAYDANGHSVEYGYGCIDAEAAVREVLRNRNRARMRVSKGAGTGTGTVKHAGARKSRRAPTTEQEPA